MKSLLGELFFFSLHQYHIKVIYLQYSLTARQKKLEIEGKQK